MAAVVVEVEGVVVAHMEVVTEEAPAGVMEEAPAVDDFKFLGKNCGTCGKRVLKLATSIY